MRKILLFLLTIILGGVAWLVYEELRRSGAPRPATPRRQPPPSPPRQRPSQGPTRCVATTRSGKRCSRDAEPGSELCWQHGG